MTEDEIEESERKREIKKGREKLVLLREIKYIGAEKRKKEGVVYLSLNRDQLF